MLIAQGFPRERVVRYTIQKSGQRDKHQAERLGRAYLRRWAQHLGVTDLLDRALGI